MALSEFIVRSCAAFLFGAIIGIERQWRQRTAGLRTNTLVSVSSALFVLASLSLEKEASPTRVAAQIVSGIGFLGAGVIIKDGLNIRGLNTAATLWGSAAIGVLSGYGLLKEAFIATLLILFLHVGLRPVTLFMNKTSAKSENIYTIYRLEIQSLGNYETKVRHLLSKYLDRDDLHLRSLESEDIPKTSKVLIKAEVIAEGKPNSAIENLLGHLVKLRQVQKASWQILEQGTE